MNLMVGKNCGDDQRILMWEGYYLSPFTRVKMMGHAMGFEENQLQ
jgi:hypothetical protein